MLLIAIALVVVAVFVVVGGGVAVAVVADVGGDVADVLGVVVVSAVFVDVYYQL